MQKVDLKHLSVRPRNPFAGWERKVHAILVVAFLGSFLWVWLDLGLHSPLVRERHWPDGLLLLLVTATTLASLTRQLPAQNVLLAATSVGLMGGAIHAIGGLTGIPFGPLVYNQENIGRFLFPSLPWPVPFIWVAVLLNARGVARLILRPRRGKPDYGLWVIGTTVALVVLFVLSFEPYATQVKGSWSWKPTKLPSNWYSAPWVNFSGWALAALLILLFVTPTLISKRPVPAPPSFHPLLIWEVLSFLFLTGSWQRHLWAAVALTASQMAVVGIFAGLGGKWSHGKPVPGRKRAAGSQAESSS
jgi:uncharacterized membrane protein